MMPFVWSGGTAYGDGATWGVGNPARPVGLAVTATDSDSITLSWSLIGDNERGQIILRQQLVDGAWWPLRAVKQVAPNTESTTDETVQPNRTYRYVIRTFTDYASTESSTITVTTPGPGLPTDQAPATGWRVEITPPNGSTRDLSITNPTLLPTINGTPSMRLDLPRDETWQQDRYDDADAAVWRDGIKQPLDSLDSRELTPGSTTMELSGGSQLGQRVVARSDEVEPVANFVERLITNRTTYDAVVDNQSQQIREDLLLQQADTQAELQATFDLPDTSPIYFDGDTLAVYDTSWTAEAETVWPQTVSSSKSGYEPIDEWSNGGAGIAIGSIDDFDLRFETDYAIPAGSLSVAFRSQRKDLDSFAVYELYLDGTKVEPGNTFGNDELEWTGGTVINNNTEISPGSHRLEGRILVQDSGFGSDPDVRFDVISVYDNRFSYDFDNQVHEPEGALDGPEPKPDLVRTELDQINTPLAVVEATLSATTVSGDTLPELALRDDGDGNYVTEADTLSTTITYDTLAAEAQGRVGLGRKTGLTPRDQTPRLGYESKSLDTVSLEADLDETPVLINRTFDDKLIDILREAMEIYDGGFEIREGSPPEVHVTRIDGRPVDIDPAISDVSVDRDTSGAVDIAIVYAAAESIRQLPFSATQDQWEQLPLNDGRIVEQSETIRDGPSGSPLDRGDDYQIREVVDGGPPEIKLLVSVSDPHLDCQFKPRGKRVAADAPQYPDEIVRDAPELNSQQMADLAAFQAVEGSYTSATIDATVELPPGEIGFEVLDALNVANLPGDEPYQIRDVDVTPQRIRVRLGAGQTAAEAIQEIRDRTSRVSERV